MTFLYPGHGESAKGAAHAGMCGLAGVFTLYNLAAFALRREKHLAVNTVLYAALFAVEVAQVARHWGAR